MRCTDKELTRQQVRRLEKRKQKRKAFLFLALLIVLIGLVCYGLYLFVFRSHELVLENPFRIEAQQNGVYEVSMTKMRGESFSNNLCVTDGDVAFEEISLPNAHAGAIMDMNDRDVLYAKNIFDRLYPASLTKVMTAMVAIKYGNLDDVVMIDEKALDIDPESSVCYLAYGDQYTLRQLIYGLLIASGNDAANAIAYQVAGSIEGFVDLMNQEAYALGATGTHFVNAHGLQDENHYTTAYDMYLMFNAAMKYDTFADAINQKAYTVTYTAADGYQYERTWFATNYYFTGESQAPEDVLVYGGKTGTTDEAGACLSLLTKDPYGNSYFSVIMNAETKDDLYSDMNGLLSIINKK